MGRPNPASFDLRGHIAIVSGANHGIGAATARLFAACGAAVVIAYLRLDDRPDPGTPETYRHNRSASGEDVAAEIRAAGGKAAAIERDLSDPASAAEVFDVAEREFGPADILVNNASGWVADTFQPHATDRLGRSLRTVSPDTIDQVFAVDARGTALLIAEFARRHIGRGATWGRIVSLTSGGSLGFPEEVSYGAAKAALANHTMSAAFELSGFGVTANVVHPPVTDTGWVTPEVEQEVRMSRELIHVASPADVAQVIAFLVSEHAHLITGNIVFLR